MPTISVDPATGRLMLDGQVLDRNDPRMYGRAGRDVTTMRTGDPNLYGPAGAFDPRYYERVLAGQDEAGDRFEYRLRPEYAERIGGRIQLGQSGVGGPGEVIDPAGVAWDDELGMVTDPANIGEPGDSGFSGFMNNGGLMALLAAGGLGAIGQAGGFAGLFGGAGGGASAAGGAALPVEVPGLMQGMAPYTAPGMLAAPNVAGGGGFLSTLGSALSGGGATAGDVVRSGASALGDAVTSNPMGALRTVGGLAAMGAGLRGGSGGSANAVGGMSDILLEQANANRYDWQTPYGSRSWSQGPDGRWTVRDSMSPEEQANYENVRGMNADATDYARVLQQRLNQRQPRDYFGSLPATDSYFGRWRG